MQTTWLVVCVLSSVLLSACAPVLRSTIAPPPSVAVGKVDRVLLKGFDYQQHYEVGRDKSITPAAGVGYSLGNIGSIIVNSIGVGLGISQSTTDRELYGDIGSVRNAAKEHLEDREIAKGVATLDEQQQLRLAPVAHTVIFDGKSGNDAVVAATPWYWSAWNVVDYVTLLAFLGVPAHYERQATVVLGVYNDKYERIAKYEGAALVSKACYVMPGEPLVETTLTYAYQDALNRAVADWPTVRAKLGQ